MHALPIIYVLLCYIFNVEMDWFWYWVWECLARLLASCQIISCPLRMQYCLSCSESVFDPPSNLFPGLSISWDCCSTEKKKNLGKYEYKKDPNYHLAIESISSGKQQYCKEQ